MAHCLACYYKLWVSDRDHFQFQQYFSYIVMVSFIGRKFLVEENWVLTDNFLP